MFGLTQREQRWKAEQKAAELLVAVAIAAIEANARVAEAEAATELERLRTENAKLREELTKGGEAC